MDIQQLKLAAERVRAFLAQSNHSVGHNQSLDIIAALPGLRNWPEVQAFPARIAACTLDTSTTGRLSFRLKKKFGVEVTPQALLAAIAPSSASVHSAVIPQIWPTGPKPGIYVTDSQSAIDALLKRYEEATDGELVYAERAGTGDGSIDLGEYGLWSSGLSRVPSGTLIVVGPIDLNQQSWNDSSERLEMACLHVLNSGHRIAVQLRTPTPETMCEDVALILRRVMGDERDVEEGLAGIISADGEMQQRAPFALPWPRPLHRKTSATADAIPAAVHGVLAQTLSSRKAGVLLLASSEIQDHWAIDLITAALALTEDVGPAARVMPRHRSTPSKDWLVPDAIKELPYLPSIESAYARGYRRIIFNPNYTDAETLMSYSEDALLIGGAHGGDAQEAVYFSRLYLPKNEQALLASIIAVLAVRRLPCKKGPSLEISDLFVAAPNSAPSGVSRVGEVADFVDANRVLRWQDQLEALLAEGLVTPGALAKEFSRDRSLKEFLAARSAQRTRMKASV